MYGTFNHRSDFYNNVAMFSKTPTIDSAITARDISASKPLHLLVQLLLAEIDQHKNAKNDLNAATGKH
jgi:hypothetical protein